MTSITKKLFMLKKLKRDVFSRATISISNDVSSSKLKEYYIVFEEDINKLNRLIVDFDEKGVPLNTTYIDVEEKKLHYYPISIGQYALAIFHTWLKTNNESKKEQFLRIAEWFYLNKIEDKKIGTYWLTDVPKPEYKVSKPWKSAFSQSRGISVMLRAWQLTGDNKYLEACKKALIPFTFDIRDGGVSAYLREGKPFFEEYVAEQPTMVVACPPFVLFGIYDFIRAVPKNMDKEAHELAQRIFNEGLSAYIKWLPKFDTGNWINYNYCKMSHFPQNNPCTVGYLRLLQTEIKILYQITKSNKLWFYYKIIKKYDRFSNILRMYFYKFRALKKLNRL